MGSNDDSIDWKEVSQQLANLRAELSQTSTRLRRAADINLTLVETIRHQQTTADRQQDLLERIATPLQRMAESREAYAPELLTTLKSILERLTAIEKDVDDLERNIGEVRLDQRESSIKFQTQAVEKGKSQAIEAIKDTTKEVIRAPIPNILAFGLIIVALGAAVTFVWAILH